RRAHPCFGRGGRVCDRAEQHVACTGDRGAGADLGGGRIVEDRQGEGCSHANTVPRDTVTGGQRFHGHINRGGRRDREVAAGENHGTADGRDRVVIDDRNGDGPGDADSGT